MSEEDILKEVTNNTQQSLDPDDADSMKFSPADFAIDPKIADHFSKMMKGEVEALQNEDPNSERMTAINDQLKAILGNLQEAAPEEPDSDLDEFMGGDKK